MSAAPSLSGPSSDLQYAQCLPRRSRTPASRLSHRPLSATTKPTWSFVAYLALPPFFILGLSSTTGKDMMASLMSYFGPRRDPKQTSRDAIVTLRQQLQMLEKKEEHLQRKIEEDLKKAKANAVSNKAVATAALKSKKLKEQELDRMQGTRAQLEVQISTLESASFNMETMSAMKKASTALKDIHGKLTLDKVDSTMAEISEHMQLANEVSEAISSNTFATADIDEEELARELGDLEQEDLNERLAGADHVPVHHPAGPSRYEAKETKTAEEDEEEALKELQAALAM